MKEGRERQKVKVKFKERFEDSTFLSLKESPELRNTSSS